MKQMPHPKKVFAYLMLAFLYVVLTVRTLFVAVPQMLREADTFTNLLAVVAIVAWLFVTYGIGYLFWSRSQPKKKGTRRKC